MMTATRAMASAVMILKIHELTVDNVLSILRVLSPALVFLSTLLLIPTRPLQPSSPSPITSVVVATRTPRRALVLSLLSLVSLTYLLDGLLFVVYAILQKHWSSSAIDIAAVVGVAAFSGLAAFGTWKDLHGVEVWSRKRVKLAITACLLLEISVLLLIGYGLKDHPRPPEERWPLPFRVLLHFAIATFRVLLLLILLPSLAFPRVVYAPVDLADEDGAPTVPTSSLQHSQLAQRTSTGLSPLRASEQSKYGTFRSTPWNSGISNPTTRSPTPAPSTHNGVTPKHADEKPDVNLEPSWTEILRRIARISRYLWPSKSKPLQTLALLCVLLLFVGRAVNLALPLTFGKLVEIFDSHEGNPWMYLGLYVVLRFLQGSGGLSALSDTLWAPVMQYSDREMSQLSFNHILNLSFAWHMRRKTGEVLRILDRGAAINRAFELVLFNIVPTFLDIVVALVVFVIYFEWTLAVVIFVVMFAYVAASVMLTRWRTRIRRQMNDRDVITRGIHTDCLLNYETVKYFGGEAHEAARYSEAIREYQVLEYKVLISLNLLNLIQNTIITIGLLVGSLIVARRVVKGESEPSDFVIFITYLAQLYGPLNGLGYVYRAVNQSLVDAERLLKLLNEPTEVNDAPDADELAVKGGQIEFDNVSFSYDGRSTALSGVSFKVPAGSSVALVGESGSGKSTILRLLYRFYDLKPGEGRILIDGKDIREVTQVSLRKAVGVVPQDPVLFNSSIEYNIGYGKFGASLAEIEAAAKAAQMHDRIVSFPDGYGTKVGERGVRLSGGEKQRVAIARTLLKNPPILLLDEATSALDTSTEKDIQKALQNLIQGRSSLSIAHRLSTIASANLIIVLRDGQIIEQGTHRELLAKDGVFASMWADQISASGELAVFSGGASKGASGYRVDTEPATLSALTSEGIQLADVPTTEEPAEGGPSAPVSFPSAAAGHEDIYVHARPTAIGFPTLDNSSSRRASSIRIAPGSHSDSNSAPAVTFGAGVHSPPSRSETPDPASDANRKRATPTFQRLARRLSLTTRRDTSSSSMPRIPGFGRKSSSKDEPGGLRGETSVTGRESTDTTGSALADVDKDSAKGKGPRERLKKRKSQG